MKSLIPGPIARRTPSGRVNDAFARMHAAEARLQSEDSPAARAAIYTELGGIYRDLAGRRPAEWLPPIQPGEGTSHEQTYRDMAALAGLLAASESGSGVSPAPALETAAAAALAAWGTLATAAELAAWATLSGTADRLARAEILGATLHGLVEDRLGWAAASVLTLAARTEQNIGGQP